MKLIRYGRTSTKSCTATFLTDQSFRKSLLLFRDTRRSISYLEFSGIETLLHDSIYETARRCTILPSRLHMHEVEAMSKSHVNGGAFADIYKGTLNDGQVIALKVPRCFGKAKEIRKVHAVSCVRISRQCFVLSF